MFSFCRGAILDDPHDDLHDRPGVRQVGELGRAELRDAYGISWRTAVANLWPQTLFGLLVCGDLYLASPTAFYWSLPLTLGYLVAIPFAVLTASPALGRWFKRVGLCGIPEDFEPPKEVVAVLAG